MAGCNVSFLVLNLALISHVTSDGYVRKCLSANKTRIRLKCPKGHVLYKPSVLVSTGRHGTCTWSDSDCTGMTRTLQRQLYKCHWRSKCFISQLAGDKLITGQSPNCTGTKTTHILLHKPTCIPKGIVMDMCTGHSRRVQLSSGVLRSHRTYPRPRNTVARTCKAHITLESSQTIFLAIERFVPGTDSSEHVTLWTVHRNNSRTIVTKTETRKMVFHGNTTSSVLVQLKQTVGCSGGFVVPFSVYRTNAIEELMEWPKSSFPIIRNIGYIFNVPAVIEQCTAESRGSFDLACGDGEVIYSPRLSMAGYTRARPTCLFGRYPCGGYTPDLLVQAHSCYWRQNCTVSWAGSVPIIYSSQPSCIGYQASILGFSGHRCIANDKLHDVCVGVGAVDDDWGIVRSHASYPWNFDVRTGRCKRNIKIGTGHGLLVMLNDINLDPDGRDKFALVHILRRQKTTVLGSKEARKNNYIEVEGGVIQVRFTPFPQSKAGRGFILVFRRYAVKKASTGDIIKTSVPNMVLSDFPTRRSGRRKHRHRGMPGKSCVSLTWTDYFTQNMS